MSKESQQCSNYFLKKFFRQKKSEETQRMKYRVLYNPLAGLGKEIGGLDQAKKLMEGKDAEFSDVTKEGALDELFSKLEKGDKIVLCGGDGVYAGLVDGRARLPDVRHSIRHARVCHTRSDAGQPADPPQNPDAQMAFLRLLSGAPDHFADFGKNILKKG